MGVMSQANLDWPGACGIIQALFGRNGFGPDCSRLSSVVVSETLRFTERSRIPQAGPTRLRRLPDRRRASPKASVDVSSGLARTLGSAEAFVTVISLVSPFRDDGRRVAVGLLLVHL